MAQQFTKQDFYLLIYIMRSWQERENPDERWSDHMREHWGLGPINAGRDRDRLLDLAKRVLGIIRSYPKEEEEESDGEPEASEEGNESSEEEEEITHSE